MSVPIVSGRWLEIYELFQGKSPQQNMFLENPRIQRAIQRWTTNANSEKTNYPNIVDYIDTVVSGYKNDFTNLVGSTNYGSASADLTRNASSISAISLAGFDINTLTNLANFANALRGYVIASGDTVRFNNMAGGGTLTTMDVKVV